MSNSNENPLNAHLLNPDSNPTYICIYIDLYIYMCVCVYECVNKYNGHARKLYALL